MLTQLPGAAGPPASRGRLPRSALAAVGGFGLRALGAIAATARAGGPGHPDLSPWPTLTRTRALTHLGVLVAVAGCATLLSLVAFAVPAALFLAVAALATTALVVTGGLASRGPHPHLGRSLLLWASVGWGLTVASAGFTFHFAALLPDLWLAWTVGVLLLALLAGSGTQLALGAALAAGWIALAHLTDQPPLAALALLPVLALARWLVTPSVLLAPALTLALLTGLVAAAVRWQPGLEPTGPLLWALAGCGMLRLTSRLWPPGTAAVSTALGTAALVGLAAPGALPALAGAGATGTASLAPLGCWLATAALTGSVRGRDPGPLATLVWGGGLAALTAVLALAPTAAEPVSALAATGLLGYALVRCWPAATGVSAPGLVAALGWLALAVGLLVARLPAVPAVFAVLAAGGFLLLLALRTHRREARS